MQRFKSFCLLVVFALSATLASAQARIFAGALHSSAKYTIRNTKQDTEFKQGFLAGIGLTTQIEGPLYFAPSLHYSQKGYKVTSYNLPSNPPNVDARDNDVSMRSIVLTPLFQVNFSKSENFGFFRFGPGFDISFSGQEKFDSAGIKTIDRNMKFGPTSYSPATAFFNVQLGYQFANSLNVVGHYEHGLSSLNNKDLGPVILQRVLGLMVGWRFGGKK